MIGCVKIIVKILYIGVFFKIVQVTEEGALSTEQIHSMVFFGSTGMIYRWSCEALDGSDNNCLTVGSALAPSITVYGADLIEGKSYKYTVTIERSGRTAADSKVVTVDHFNLQLHCNLFKTQHFVDIIEFYSTYRKIGFKMSSISPFEFLYKTF